ncbi:MAG: hybrid sensor histidine kinase/response regulator [Bacteroidetes bacterium]|nr:MAG: hybrid sensor histidine kinase/response regulator [Bacteroidota bacterium]
MHIFAIGLGTGFHFGKEKENIMVYDSKFNILIVDDHPENLLALESILEGPDLNILKASSGNEALGVLLDYEVSLVLLDVQMPGMDGFETAELMRSNEHTKNIPIIFVTAISKQRKHIFKGYEAGAVDYLYKPLDLEILKSKVKAFIEFFKHKKELELITAKLKETVKELNRAKRLAEKSTKSKSLYLANMSHEIRTPLNGIIGIAELGLMDTELSDLQKERLQDIMMSGETLLEIINGILDISKIEANMLEIEEAEFSLRDMIEKVFAIISLKALNNGNELICDLQYDIPDMLIGDSLRIRQILVNLLSNANKFTKNGTITLSVKQEVLIEEQIRLIFSVKDTGIGIPADKIHTLFDTYTQAHKSTTREFGGTGLGLYISQSLAKLMGGVIKIDSAVGKGSEFYFTLNLLTGKQKEDLSKIAIPKDKKVVSALIVEEHPEASKILSGLLSYWNIVNKVANTKKAALKLAEEQHFDFVFVTIQPAKDNIDTLSNTIEQLKKSADNLFLLSEIKSSTLVEQIRKRSNSDLIIKPVSQCVLKREIEKSLTGVNKSGASTSSEEIKKPTETGKEKSSKERACVLVAEDQTINMKIVVQLLQRKNFKIIQAKTGKEALEIYQSQHDKIDIILMDVQMPEMDGMEATKRIREFELEIQKHTPIIAMTAHAMKGDKEQFLSIGMDDYLSKPIHPQLLYDTIKLNFKK